MVERIVDWSARHRLFIIAVFLLVSVVGAWAIATTPLDAIPDLSENQVIVFSEYMGRSPQIVEDQVTFPLVTALQGLPSIKAVRATSMFGMSFIYLIFEDNVDPYWARSRVLEKLATVQASLPAGTKTQLGPDGTGVGHVFWYTVEGKGYDLGTLRALQDWFIKPQLQSVEGVAEIASVGGYVREYQINLDPLKMQLYDVTLDDITRAVTRSNNAVGGRIIEVNGRESFVRGQGYFTSASDFRAVNVATRNGVAIPLSNVADITIGAAPRRGSLDKNGTGEVTGGIVVMRTGENAKDVIDRVKSRIAEVAPGLPTGVKIETAYDRSELIEASVATLEHTLIEEAIIVSIIILIFLFHFPSALRIVIEIPVSVLIAFILMRAFGITSNVMSLGGIAIGIGILVDASIVLLENAHRHLSDAQTNKERDGTEYDYRDVVIHSAQQVARPIFFSIIIIVVSFLPVFLLTGQEGKLFHPLAFTKTFSLLGSALVSITLVPVLMTLLMRGKMRPEEKNPVSRLAQKLYLPTLAWALKHKKTAIAVNALALAVAIPIALGLGSEFMPPLDEGSLLFMPLLVPSTSMSQATCILQAQDAIIKSYPEVEQVLGKVGKAETATDPAPQSMIETIILLKPRAQWRPGITKDKIVDDLNRNLRMPGVALGWTQPIINRINMLTTGVRTDLGVKFFGSNLDTLDRLASEAERLLRPIRGAADVAAERVKGGSFLEISLRPEAAGLYGLTPATINDVIESAIGGESAGTVVQGRERFPITVRYMQDFRGSVEELRSLPVPVPIPIRAGATLLTSQAGAGASVTSSDATTEMGSGMGTSSSAGQDNTGLTSGGSLAASQASQSNLLSPPPISRIQYVPLGALASVEIKDGPAMVSSENGLLRSIVYLNVRSRDMGSFVSEAKSVLTKGLQLPVGYTLSWSGEYEQQQHAASQLRLLIPLVFFVIFLLLYVTLKDFKEAGVVMLSVPFALIGGVFLIAVLGMNWSVAVWVGFIALYGIATETGVVMVVYLHEALDKKLIIKEGSMTVKDIYDATIEGAVLRLRPKLMTVATAMLGLVPILFSTGTGSDVMKPIAAPMVGGMLTSAIHVLIVTPIIFYVLKVRALHKGTLRKSEISGWMHH
ncbi:MAG: CusA/CzcA family heavy metal efflux RND transporter [Bacteroidota bacterium]|nr:CusA/CzcA family heavy metal efflux RND transporter [Bacteroidota bacterium]MDP4233244.1 CusA/CzcA family heavy metal efflux RND transporter [Bacteroidota bacterium]MDP4242136.1 CusA/CzcA family heavy metal efflux RND transporter [Bacteroidota bacterium]MDP4287785.1 CusA/CzcA family heavy metal efflux RND transporter [Bacteroidota bacterium]